MITVNLRYSASVYTQSIQNTLANLFAIDVEHDSQIEARRSLLGKEDIYFSILFTGQVYGEFLIGLNRKTALEMLGFKSLTDAEADYHLHRSEVLDSFKELINIAAGTTLTQLRATFPDLSITPPRAIEGRLTLSEFEILSTHLRHPAGELNCYIYIDYMKLGVAESFDKQKEKQEELRRLNKAKSEFLANMSHELRTPLNGMIGMLDLLKASALSATQIEQIEFICKSGDFLLTIINDILEFSRIESGKLEIETRSFDLRQSVIQVAEGLSAEIFNKGLDFQVYVSPNLGESYLGDETRIKQVLVNLIGNAVKFTPTGSILVDADVNADGHVVIKVSDTGIGIPASKLNAIFESFSQADVSDNRKYGGSGLGLTISRSIVHAMKGVLDVASEEAKGSTFTITLPLLSEKKDVTTPAVDPVQWVTDNPTLQRLLTAYVKPSADDVVTAPLVIDSKKLADMPSLPQAQRYVVLLARPQELAHLTQTTKDWVNKDVYILSLPLNPRRLIETLIKRPRIHQVVQTDGAPSAKSTTGQRRVLLVEDNEINQRVASSMLVKLGFEVSIASDGEQAVESVRSQSFDVVLMDCQMPKMNGYEATAAIRELDRQLGRHTPIIAMTANAFRETKERCFECGMDDFVTKPIKTEGLSHVIDRTLEKLATRAH